MRLMCLIATQVYCRIESPVNLMGHSLAARQGATKCPFTLVSREQRSSR